MRLPAICAALAACALARPAPAATEIQFWHSMSGTLGERAVELVEKFNASQRDVRVIPVFKGSPEETTAAGLAVARTLGAPNVIQIAAADSANMLAASNAFKPLYLLMAESAEKFDPKGLLPAFRDSYSDDRGRMLSLPFNGATAVFYFNKDVFRKARLDPDKPPRTWQEVQVAALAIRDGDAAPCGLTTDRPAWIHVENLSAWHNEPIATRADGHAGAGVKLVFNGELLIRHLGLLSSWAKSEIFTYAGRANEGESRFSKGECAMLTSSSAAYVDIARNANFDLGVAPLPHYEEFPGAPYATLAAGGSLWALAGKKPAEYKGVARFFAFLMRPEVQAEWTRRTGFLAITTAAVDLARNFGGNGLRPDSEVAMKQLSGRRGLHSRGPRLVPLAKIRTIINEELEAVWAQNKTPKDALDAAVERGNELLRRDEQAREAIAPDRHRSKRHLR